MGWESQQAAQLTSVHSARPQNKPAIELARASYTPTGRIVTNTLAAVLTLLLASPAYDTFKLYKVTQKAEREHYDPSLRYSNSQSRLFNRGLVEN